MRLPDWQTRFSAFGKERAAMPFLWGTNDCCMFAADAVLAMTGIDYAESFRGQYSDALGASRMVRARGGYIDMISELLGEHVSTKLASVGDVVLIVNEGRELLAICNGTNAVGPGPQGMLVMSMDDALAAWRI